MSQRFALTQPQRLAALVADLMVVVVACYLLFGVPYPPVGPGGFWAHSAVLAVLLGSRLMTPFYVKPVDAISYAAPALVSLLLINDWNNWSLNQRWGFSLAAGFSSLITSLGLLNIAINSLSAEWAKNASNGLRILLDVIGRPEFIYAPLIVLAMFLFHRDSWMEAVVIGLATTVTVWWSTGTYVVGSFYRIKASFQRKGLGAVAGQVVAYQEPGIVLVRQQREGDIKRNDLLYISDKHGPKKLVVALDHVGRSEGVLMRTVVLRELSDESQSHVHGVSSGESAYHLDLRMLEDVCEQEGISREQQENLVGLVAPDTTIETLYFEVTNNSELEEGRLIVARVGSRDVMYQIVSGLTKEEVVQQKNTYGYLRGQAHQVGVWAEESERFSPCNWLPTMNTPVYLQGRTPYSVKVDSVGHFPGSDLHVRLKSVSDLVTHNTAILGILGVGKSMLAIELVERIMAAGIKVICLDLTNQYSKELSDFYDSDYEATCLASLREASEKDREVFSDNPDRGGSLPNLREAIIADLAQFLDVENPRRLKIYNPAAFVASKQIQEPKSYSTGQKDHYGKEMWARGAALWDVTPVEITKIVSEAALQILSAEMSTTARACLVYEEAHSLVPEWNAVVNEGDRVATSGTARAILQGRKYGLGCLLITQRTANVTKTILNQCNTVFAMRTFDQTGKEFLANYIGQDYANSLSSIPERHAVFFGKASACENPVLLRLNDQAEFRSAFRIVNPPPDLRAGGPVPMAESVAVMAATADFDDDIPF